MNKINSMQKLLAFFKNKIDFNGKAFLVNLVGKYFNVFINNHVNMKLGEAMKEML